MVPVTLLCVLKTGGVYDDRYVRVLFNSVRKHTPERVIDRMVCLTDSKSLLEDSGVETVPLRHGWGRWWSKIELYRPDLDFGPSIFLDLDTLVLGDLRELAGVAVSQKFVPLKGFNQALRPPGGVNLATGVMVGQFGRYASEVYTRFVKEPKKHMRKKREKWKHGDQGFVAETLGMSMPRLQDFLPANYIVGKKLIKGRGGKIHPSAHLVAWSGKPRFHDMDRKSIIYKRWVEGGRDVQQ